MKFVENSKFDSPHVSVGLSNYGKSSHSLAEVTNGRPEVAPYNNKKSFQKHFGDLDTIHRYHLKCFRNFDLGTS